MLLSLQADQHQELRIPINQMEEKIYSEHRTDHIEQHLSDATKAHNTIVDIQDDQATTIHMLRFKVTYLEDHHGRTI